MGTGNQCFNRGDGSLLICNTNTLVTLVQSFLLWQGSKSGHYGPLSEPLLFKIEHFPTQACS
jgi:hypothetical protein